MSKPAVSRMLWFPGPYADVPKPVWPMAGRQRGLTNFVNELILSFNFKRPMSAFRIVGVL